MRTIQRSVWGMLVLFFFITPASFAQRGPGGGGPMQPSTFECDETGFTVNGVVTESKTCIDFAGPNQSSFIVTSTSHISACPGGWNSLVHSATPTICRQSDNYCFTGSTNTQTTSSATATAPLTASNDGANYYGKGLHSYQVDANDPLDIENSGTTTFAIGNGGGL